MTRTIDWATTRRCKPQRAERDKYERELHSPVRLLFVRLQAVEGYTAASAADAVRETVAGVLDDLARGQAREG